MLCLRHPHPDNVYADLEAIADLEARSFPEAEAASRERLAERLAVYPDRFWLLFDEGRLVAYAAGLATSTRDLTDEMYADAALHEAQGPWQMLFSVCTDPELRHIGLAHHVLSHLLAEVQGLGCQGVVLTCKEPLIPFYASFGFVSEGISVSTHGNVAWTQMRLTFQG